MKAYSDEELVLQAQQGNETAFNELYDRYHKRLEYIAVKLCKNSEDAKDAVQQTFLQVHTSLASLREANRFYHWCCKIIHGKCTDIFRKNKDLTLDMESSAVTNVMVEERSDFLPQSNFHFQSDREVLSAMIAQLPLQQRQVILLVYFEQMSMQDCAAVLDIPEGTVKSRLYTAKKTLKEMILLYNEQHAEAPLNFKSASLSVALSAVLLYDFQKASPVSLSTVKSYHHGISHTFTQILLSIACCVTVGSAGFVYYSNRSHNTDAVVKNESVIYRNRIVNTSKEAYFLLRNWAVDERQMRNRDSEEIAEAKKLYEFLKANNDAYYDVLVNDDWTHDFESLLK